MLAPATAGQRDMRAQLAFGRCLLELENTTHRPPAIAIALDDALAERVGYDDSPAILRIWQCGPAVVLPRRHLSQSQSSVIDKSGRAWQICARSSGGAAVAQGPGTLNMSMILPLSGPLQPSIEAGYQLWIAVLDAALSRACNITVGAALAEGAFCAGPYDGTVAGRKLAGTAQVRRNGSAVIHGTILTHVNRTEYLTLIHAAERIADISNSDAAYGPERIASLHELAGRAVPALELASALRAAATNNTGSITVDWDEASPVEVARAEVIAEQQRSALSKGGTDAE